ncbi:MAG: 50S ribosomal protein L15 [Methanomicrobiales archaeon]|nr:50S ribosomal protein L15 [Methanomicrobiales archaeon]
MPVNKRSKYRGSRTCGAGTHKNRRGGGSRGGRGHSGGCKHHFMRYYAQGVTYGKNGFSPLPRSAESVMDVGVLDMMTASLLQQEMVTQEGDIIAVDMTRLGVDKVLGGGKVLHKLHISAHSFSALAREKIEAAGGKAEII